MCTLPCNPLMLPSIKVLESGDQSELLDMIRKVDLTVVRDADNNTLLHHACMLGNVQAVRLLLDCGLHADVGNVNGHTPLCDAALHGSVEVISMLLTRGVDVNPPSYWTSPLVNATLTENLEAMRLLIRAGSNVDSPDRTRFCPLHIAVNQRFYAGMKELLLAGANPNQPVRLVTPLHMATQLHDRTAVAYLLAHGANPSLLDMHDCSPLDYADKTTNAAVFSLLNSTQQKPLSLQCLARLAFWRANRGMEIEHLQSLPIPRFVTDFLTFNIL